jgi:hypothetical protein
LFLKKYGIQEIDGSISSAPPIGSRPIKSRLFLNLGQRRTRRVSERVVRQGQRVTIQSVPSADGRVVKEAGPVRDLVESIARERNVLK